MPARTQTKDSTRNRLLVLAALFVVVLVVLLVRLWSMQLIHGAEYAEQSNAQRITEVTTVAPRGRILDRNGDVLVDNRVTTAVVADNTVKNDAATLQRLSNLLGIPQSAITMRMEGSREANLAPKVVAYDASTEAVAYISEHQELFQGVTIEPRTVRTYPNGSVAAHVLGYTGGISDEELKKKSFVSYNAGDTVGKAGVEAQYESILQGDRGVKTVEIDAGGRILNTLDEVPAHAGSDVQLTLDLRVQKATEKALKDSFANAAKLKYTKADAGAIIAMDVKTGGVISMASYPTYNPANFIGGIDENEWEKLSAKKAKSPLTNRAISGNYAPASTFKAFVGSASLEDKVATANSVYNCQGTWTGMGKEWPKKCWLLSGHGSINFTNAIAQSCDVAFYEMGYSFYKKYYKTKDDENPNESLQDYLRTWGYGSKTGIDLPGETEGRIPDAKWKKEYNKDFPENAMWLPGDTTNLAIGQGDVLSTPMQIATSYSGIANDGTVMTPHVFKAALDAEGEAVIEEPIEEVENQPKLAKKNLKTIQAGLRKVVTDGTAKKTFSGFKVQTAGKSGTAQVAKKDNYALYVGYAPYDKPKYCVVVVVEQGGGGSAVAAAACREVFASLFKVDEGNVSLGDDHSR